ncbi:phosphoenolpyruvate--protein phosphotransferase [Phenylobacterium deserti]|uniref:phosphoenolpyruvate--protein phosphotransferase n=1 Tax=Phenylobacterium deserti TaxID=1914756 RepID=UPI001F0C2059|nr:phosphoenolpyruvate--protein phosphotransferase [Phenylobacterium deserti]
MAADLVLASPLGGWCAPLSEAPDPVFAEAMLGDGVAIDPIGSVLHAPLDAVVIGVHAARHAVTLRADGGLEILLHVGLETVALGGEGFEPLVRDGDRVRLGDPLLRFDLDLLARRAKSLITPMVLTSLGPYAVARRLTDRAVRAGEPVLELSRTNGAAVHGAATLGPEVSRSLRISLAHGVHARPAARIAETAKRFAAEIWVGRAGRKVSARSPVALMSLGLRHGDEAVVIAAGADAEAALDAVYALIESGMGEGKPLASTQPKPQASVETITPTLSDGVLRGVTAAPGLAIGRAARFAQSEMRVPEAGQGVAHEQAALVAALATVRTHIAAASEAEADPTRKAILSAHAGFAEDPELVAEAERLVGEGRSAGFAWRAATNGFAEALRGLADPRMAERVDDLKDLERRVLAIITGEADAGPEIPQGSILLADELLPSQLMGSEPGRILGVCTARGGPTSHVAILAAAMGIPAVVAAGPGVLSVPDGAGLILDADSATLSVAPDAKALEAAQVRLAARAERRAAARAAAGSPAVTLDGVTTPVLSNLGSLADARAAVAAGADGSGLLRTEFLFLHRETPPSEDEQAEEYRQILEAMDGRPVVIRLLDVGGDKAAPYLPQTDEENPALGVRGVRLLLRRPQLLKAQLRAILRAAPVGACSIMVPMVARMSELRAVRSALDDARKELDLDHAPELGVMIETPAAAMVSTQLAAEADFFSIGTNDLTQYGLAMDRGNPELAAEVDGLDPAVLGLVARTCEGAARHGRSVSVCGGLAADPAAIPILLGLGVSRLSMISGAVAEAKAQVRSLLLANCRDLAVQALAQPSAEAVRNLVGHT